MSAFNIPDSQQNAVKDLIAVGQPVDMETTREFIEQTLENVALTELRDVEDELQEKSDRFRILIAKDNLPSLKEEQLLKLLRAVFATRRRAKEILKDVGAESLREAIYNLLYGQEEPGSRFDNFVQQMTGYFEDVRVLRPKKSIDSRARESAEEAALQENVFCDLGSEILHFSDPDLYWLWTRWIWDPKAGTGALPLVAVEEINLYGKNVGESYMKIGLALTFVKETGNAAGYENFSDSPFSIDVFMACVYAVYLYTTLRIRMTQEFNKVVPQLPELIRRILGVWKLEL